MSSTFTTSKSTTKHFGEASPHTSVYEQVTQRIIALLERGTVPWQKPWKIKTGMPRNLVTKHPYRGINIVLLWAMDFESPYWLTYNQAHELGGYIRKGEKSTPVVFWKTMKPDKQSKEPDDNISDDSEPVQTNPLSQKRPQIIARLYNVFNLSQAEGLKNFPPLSEHLGTTTEPAKVYENMPNKPVIKHGMRSAFYSPSEDVIGMPSLTNFTDESNYWNTLWHELTHSTGAKHRLNRSTLTASEGFGSDPYCKEELIAEMGAAFLCAHADITERTVNNSAAYLQSWLGKLKADKTFIVSAASQAQQAVDWILKIKLTSFLTIQQN